MRLKTPVLVLVGFISLATFTQAVSPSGSQAVPLKHRILSEAKNGGSNEEGNSKVQLSEIQGGIMDKVAPSKLTLAQEDEEKKKKRLRKVPLLHLIPLLNLAPQTLQTLKVLDQLLLDSRPFLLIRSNSSMITLVNQCLNLATV